MTFIIEKTQDLGLQGLLKVLSDYSHLIPRLAFSSQDVLQLFNNSYGEFP